jgi:aerotolerance regulator-like protein/VWA domain-containing protein
MSFINPFLLWGLAAASVPIIIHLLNRRRFKHQRWAAMEWLLRAAKQNKRRLQIQNLLLLLLRTLAILLIALAISRPTFSDSPLSPVSSTRAHLFVLLDNSASMGARGGTRTAFDEAVAAANGLVSEIGNDDPVTLVVTNDNTSKDRSTGRARAVLDESRDHGKVRSLLSEMRPAAARADLLDAIKVIEDKVPEKGGIATKVAILTDLQEITLEGVAAGDRGGGGNEFRTFLERLRDKGADVLLIAVGREVDNVSVASLRPDENRDIVEGNPARFVAEVVNYSSREQRVEVKFLVDGEVQGDSGRWISLPPRPAGNEPPPAVPAEFDVRFDGGGVRFHTIEARIDTDPLPADDARVYAFNVRPPIRVLAVDGDADPADEWRTSETYWLAPALALEEGGPFSVEVIRDNEFAGRGDLSPYDLIILANVARPAADDEARNRLERYVKDGGALLLTMGDQVVSDVWNEELYQGGNGILPARLGVRYYNPDDPLLIDLGENDHPAMRAITDPDMSAFFQPPRQHGFIELTGVAGEKHSRTVLRYDLTTKPALIHKRLGSGNVMLFTSTVDEDWGELPGSFVFPALLHETVYYLTARGEAERNLLTYQPYRRTLPANADTFEITAPDGSQPLVEQDAAPDEAATVRFPRTDQTGLYSTKLTFKPDRLLAQPPADEEAGFAVNLSPLEGDLRRLHPEELETRWRGLITIADSFEAAADAVKTRGGEVSTHLLILALLCMLGEVLVARRIGTARSRAA